MVLTLESRETDKSAFLNFARHIPRRAGGGRVRFRVIGSAYAEKYRRIALRKVVLYIRIAEASGSNVELKTR